MRGAALVFLVWSCAGSLLAQTSGSLELQLRNREAHSVAQTIMNAWKSEYNEGDAGSVATLYLPDAYYLTQGAEDGIVRGQSSIQARIQRGIEAKFRIDDIRIVTVERTGNLIYVIWRYDATNGRQEAFGVSLALLREIGPNEWRIAAHETTVTTPASAVQSLE